MINPRTSCRAFPTTTIITPPHRASFQSAFHLAVRSFLPVLTNAYRNRSKNLTISSFWPRVAWLCMICRTAEVLLNRVSRLSLRKVVYLSGERSVLMAAKEGELLKKARELRRYFSLSNFKYIRSLRCRRAIVLKLECSCMV